MNRALRSFLFAILAFAAGTWLLCRPRQQPSPTPISAAPVAPTSAVAGAPASRAGTIAASSPAAAVSGRGFRSRDRLAEHFAKHGAEVEASTAQAYLALAQALRDAPAGDDILEIVRPTDGVVSRFDKRTGAFGAFDPDGTIRTFFRPNDGEAYFRRQARRLPGA
jgi:hypothetical protein